MKNLFSSVAICLAFITCTSENEDVFEPINDQPTYNENQSEKGHMELIGSIQMTDGPTDLLIDGNNLYAVRDSKIFQYGLSNPALPNLINTYELTNPNHKFGKLAVIDGKLFVPCLNDGFMYEFNSNLNLNRKHELGLSMFIPNTTMKDAQGIFWIGGSNGSKGMLAKYSNNNGQLNLVNYTYINSNETNIEAIIEANQHVIVSLAKGNIMTFTKSNLNIVDDMTFDNEAGHEKWGHTLIKNGNKAYWANWGAGFATLDISNPSHITIDALVSNSTFKAQFPDAEGTNVYDVAYNAEKNLICIANGWSGVLLVRPNSPDVVLDYIDPKDFQNRSIETKGNYIYTGNISGGMSGNLKGIKIFKINL